MKNTDTHSPFANLAAKTDDMFVHYLIGSMSIHDRDTLEDIAWHYLKTFHPDTLIEESKKENSTSG